MTSANLPDECIDILLVDDREENLVSLAAILESAEYRIAKVTSGAQALRYLLRNTPAIILMDVQMPDMTGFETAELIKKSERTREIPIIFVTAQSHDEYVLHKGYDYGGVDYIYKPCDPHVLRSKVAAFAEIQRQHNRISRWVRAQHSATQALAAPASEVSAVTSVLASICSNLRWDLGLFWKVETESSDDVLACLAQWHKEGTAFPHFISESFKKRRFLGRGLPGRVWQSQMPLWVTDLHLEPHFSRQSTALRERLRTGVVLPMKVQNEVLGVFEFYSGTRMPEDSHLVQIMEAIGSQVAQFLKRTDSFSLVKAAEARKAAILEASLDGIITMDHAGKIIEFNSAAERTFGYTRAEVLGREMVDVIIPPEFREAHRSGFHMRLPSGEGIYLNRRTEMVGMRADKTEFPIELSITRVAATNPPVYTGFLRDITERKNREEGSAFLIESSSILSASLDFEKAFTNLAQNTTKYFADFCAFDVFDKDSHLKSVATAHGLELPNEIFLKLQESYLPLFRVEEVANTNLAALYPDVTKYAKQEGSSGKRDAEARQKLGLCSALVVPLTARSKTVGVLTLITSHQGSGRVYSTEDLILATELARRAAIAIDNSSLYRAAQDAVRSRDDFFSIASHELKTPITSLRMSLQLAQRNIQLQKPEKLGPLLTTSIRQVDRLTHLVEDLLDVVRIRAGKMSYQFDEFNLSELVQNVIEQCAESLSTARCELKLNIAADVKGVWDQSRIEQIVVNLISNAIKYAPHAPVYIELSVKDERAKLVVQDSGPGIPLEQQAKIFERFERATATNQVAGLGLGLFIVKKIVEAHNGSIYIENHDGTGARFVVELPTHAMQATHEQVDAHSQPAVRQENLSQATVTH